jgi:predicted dehydrogenase
MSQKARIAVIGTGWWATYAHIPALKNNPQAEIVALCDRDPERLKKAADAYQIGTTYTDINDMLANETIDGVIVATPHATHYGLVKTALEHNLHVMVEKPMVLHANEARELVDIAKERGVELIVGYPWHYNWHVIKAREIIASGELGKIQYVNCMFSSFMTELFNGRDGSEDPNRYVVNGPGSVYSQPHLSGGGMGHLQVTHSAGLMFFVSGLRARRVHGLMAYHGLAVDLIDVMTVEFEGGALGVVSGHGNGIHRKLDLQIHCEHGAIDMDWVANTTTIRRAGQEPEHWTFESEEEAYQRHITSQNLVEVILGTKANGSDGTVGWRTVELLDASYRSAKLDGAPVLIEDLYK